MDALEALTIQRAIPYRRVCDLDAEIAAYTRLLGYAVEDELRDDAGERFWAMLRNGESRVMLSNRPVHGRSRLTWLYVEDADAAHAAVVAAGGKPLSAPEDQWHGCREFLLETPTGETYVIAHLIPRRS
jgi:predicted enzyme related to lactoylglutathione lyase